MSAEATVAAQPAADNGDFAISVSGAGERCVLRGPLTFATARGAHAEGLRVLETGSAPQVEVDCSGITRSDSAGLVVLLDWLSAAKRARRSLRFVAIPAGLLALAAISDVQQLLEKGV